MCIPSRTSATSSTNHSHDTDILAAYSGLDRSVTRPVSNYSDNSPGRSVVLWNVRTKDAVRQIGANRGMTIENCTGGRRALRADWEVPFRDSSSIRWVATTRPNPQHASRYSCLEPSYIGSHIRSPIGTGRQRQRPKPEHAAARRPLSLDRAIQRGPDSTPDSRGKTAGR